MFRLLTIAIFRLYMNPKDSCKPEDGYCWKAETCSCTLGSNVNTPVPSNKQVVLD